MLKFKCINHTRNIQLKPAVRIQLITEFVLSNLRISRCCLPCTNFRHLDLYQSQKDMIMNENHPCRMVSLKHIFANHQLKPAMYRQIYTEFVWSAARISTCHLPFSKFQPLERSIIQRDVNIKAELLSTGKKQFHILICNQLITLPCANAYKDKCAICTLSMKSSNSSKTNQTSNIHSYKIW